MLSKIAFADMQNSGLVWPGNMNSTCSMGPKDTLLFNNINNSESYFSENCFDYSMMELLST